MWPVASDPEVVILGGVDVVAVAEASASAVMACLMMNEIREVLPIVTMTLQSIS